MQLQSKATIRAQSFEVAQEQCASLQNEAKWLVVWAGLWIVALAILLPALL
jgi:hypothetical protein